MFRRGKPRTSAPRFFPSQSGIFVRTTSRNAFGSLPAGERDVTDRLFVDIAEQLAHRSEGLIERFLVDQTGWMLGGQQDGTVRSEKTKE